MELSIPTHNVFAGRTKFLIGGLLILAAIVYLVISSTQSSAEYFLTINELQARGATLVGKDVRISGAVVGDTIQYDPQTLTLKFSVANVPGDNNVINAEGGLAAVLHAAVINQNNTRMQVIYNGPKPDLMRNEAQAIMTGQVDSKGVFHASELLLKCPTKYQQAVPGQTGGQTNSQTSGQVSSQTGNQ